MHLLFYIVARFFTIKPSFIVGKPDGHLLAPLPNGETPTTVAANTFGVAAIRWRQLDAQSTTAIAATEENPTAKAAARAKTSPVNATKTTAAFDSVQCGSK